MITFQTSFFRMVREGVLGLLCLALPLMVQAAPDSSGWPLLQKNADGAARAAFKAALQKNPADAEALRGLGWAQQQANDELGAVQTWRRLYAVAPASWAAAALWPQMTTLAKDTGRWDLLEGAAHDILAAKDPPASLSASARLALAQSAARSGRAAVAARQWASLGYIRCWQVIGPFDNASQSGFDKVYPPEQQIALGSASLGKDDQTLHWHPLGLVGLEGQCEVGQSLGDSDADVFYAVTAIQSPRVQNAVLKFDPTGASKISVNGVWIFADSIKRSHTDLLADPFAVPVTLQAGWNTVVIKLCDDEKLGAAFALRITTPDGAALTTLPIDPLLAKSASVKSLSAGPVPQPAPVETVTTALLRRQPATLETAMLLGETLRLAQDYPASAAALRQGLIAAPDCGLLHWELSQTLSADEQTDEARSERDLALKQNPHLTEAALDAVSEVEDTVSPGELVTRARAVVTQNQVSSDALLMLAHAYDKAKLNPDALKTERLAVALSPGTGPQTTLVDMLKDQNKNAEAGALLARLLKVSPGDTALLAEQADLFSDADNYPAAIAVYRRLLALAPSNQGDRIRLAKLQTEAHQPAAAVANLRLAHAQRPQNADTSAALADALLDQGQSKEAARLYQDAIRLDPSQLTLRDKLAVLTGAKPVLDLAPETDSAPILAAAPKLKADPGASAMVLLDEGRTVVYPDFATLTRFHQIIKLVDQSAVQRYATYPLARSTSTAEATVESARVIKADGKVQDVTDNADNDSVSFPSLAPGDLIDVSYRVEDYHRGGLAHQFWSQWFFTETGTSSRQSRFVLITPSTLTFTTRNHGSIPDPTIHDAGGWRVREWRMTDIPANQAEIMGTGENDSGTWLDISTITSWAQVVQWYEDLSAPRCVPDSVIRAKALDLTKEAKTDDEKIHALQAFVAREVQYQSSPFRLSAYVPTEGKEVIRERYGDCKDKAALLTALLAAVGIKSDMVLLSGRSHGLSPYLPSPRFNHAIARVQTAQGPLFVDATADQLDFGDLPADDQQVPVLVIAPSTTDLTETPVLPVSNTLSEGTYADTLSEDGTLRGTFEWTLTGRLAWGVRSVLREVPEAQHEELLHTLANYLLKGAVCESDGIEHAADPDLPLQLHFACHVDHYSTSAGSFLLMPLPWSGEAKDATTAALLAEPKRIQDLEAANSCARTHSVAHIRLPAGYLPQEMPAEVHQDSPFGSFRMGYSVEGGMLTATRDVDLTAFRVAAQDVPRYAAFLKAMNEEMTRQIVLKKP